MSSWVIEIDIRLTEKVEQNITQEGWLLKLLLKSLDKPTMSKIMSTWKNEEKQESECDNKENDFKNDLLN